MVVRCLRHALGSSSVEASKVKVWFAEYLAAFAALGRGESRPGDVAARYGVPLLVTTDDLVITLETGDEVEASSTQADAMSAAGYRNTRTLARKPMMKRNTALLRGRFSRQRTDGSEINQMSVTYVITRESETFRISALVVQTS